jgi:hypothetical protein
MKIKIFSCIIIFFIIYSCEKDGKKNITNDQAEDYKIFNLHVQKSTNNEKLTFYSLHFIQTTWVTGSNYKDSIMYYNKTDLNGDVTFKIKSNEIQNKGNIFYTIGTSANNSITITDSLKNELLYSGSVQVYHDGDASYNSIMRVSPSCEVKFEILKTLSVEKGIDTLYVSNITVGSYEYKIPAYTLTGEDIYYAFIKADCSNSNTIKYYYYSNGLKSKDYFKEIYIPFNSRGLSISICTLDFK